MREVLKGIMPLSEKDREAVLGRATVVLDTNVLLDMYKYSRPTSTTYLNHMRHVQKQLWIPYQVAFEFLKNRQTVRLDATKPHSQLITRLETLRSDIGNAAKKSHVEKDQPATNFVRSVSRYLNHLGKQRDELRDWAKDDANDDILDTLSKYFGGKAGPAPTADWLTLVEGDAKKRYAQKVPPGYEDDKKETNSYGDYILWRQCIEQCINEETPLLFVTSDAKGDWWTLTGEKKGRTGPRIELLREFYESTGQQLVMMDAGEFMYWLGQKDKSAANRHANKAALDEVSKTQAERYAAVARAANVGVMPAVAVFSDYLNSLWPLVSSEGLHPYTDVANMLKMANQSTISDLGQMYEFIRREDESNGRTRQAFKSMGIENPAIRPVFEPVDDDTGRQGADDK